MRLRELRKNNRLKQNDIAQYLHVAESTYRGYENDSSEPNLSTIKKIADYYNVSLDYLCEHETTNLIDTSSFSDTKKGCVLLLKKLNEQNATILLGYITHMVQEQNKA